MKLRLRRVFWLLLVIVAVVHCGRRGGTQKTSPQTLAKTTSLPKALLSLHAPAASASSSTLALARAGTRLFAFVTDDDAPAVHMIDIERAAVVASLTLPAVAGHIVVHGAALALALRGTNQVRTVSVRGSAEQPELTLDETIVAAPFDPLALASDGQGLVIASASSALLRRGEVTVALPRDPRALLLTADASVRVAHATGSTLTTVTTAGSRSDLSLDLPSVCTTECSGDSLFECARLTTPPALQSYALAKYAGFVLVPTVSSLTDGPFPDLVSERAARPWAPGQQRRTPNADYISHGYGVGNVSTPITFRIDVLDAGAGPGTTALTRASRTGVHACTLPRGMAVDEASHQVWIACLDSGEILRHVVTQTQRGLTLTPQRDVLQVPFVAAVAYDAASERLVAHAPFERAVTIASGSARTTVALPRVELDPGWAAGRRLFVATDARISRGKKACESCHPDGGDDGLVWETPLGPRRTLALSGRLGSGPFRWDGTQPSLESHVVQTVDENLHGTGLSAPEISALLHYLVATKAPLGRPVEGAALHGRELFSGAAECSTCHVPEHQFRDGLVHDVGAGLFRTPPLLGLAGRDRFFHDGRYRTLDQVLTVTDGRMGHTAFLAAEDRAALLAYLGTL